MSAPGADDGLDSLRYEELVDLLEELTRQMASGEVGIEEAARLYERADVVHRQAVERLERVRERIAAIDARSDVGVAKGAGDRTATGSDVGEEPL